MKTIVIIPCFNESDSIKDVVEEIKKRKLDYVVVNDGSTDETTEIINQYKYNSINLVNNLGIGGAMQAGFQYALENNYDLAVQFDGDGQHNADNITILIECLKKNKADMVIGSRFIEKGDSFQSTKARRVGISILSNLFRLGTKRELLDMTSGFRVVNKKIIGLFASNYPSEYPEPVTNFMLAKKEYKIIEIPTSMNERKFGKSSITPMKSVYYMINVILLFCIISIKGEDINV